jgi:hypothetical protein
LASCQRTQKHRHLIAGRFLPLDERASDDRGLADDALGGDRFGERKVSDQHEEERLDFDKGEAEATGKGGKRKGQLGCDHVPLTEQLTCKLVVHLDTKYTVRPQLSNMYFNFGNALVMNVPMNVI